MGAYLTEIDQAKSFVEKTLQIISQYECAATKLKFEKLEVTLWINCLIGLLIVPQQYFSSHEISAKTKEPLLITAEDENDWGIQISNIDYGIGIKKDEFENDAHLIAKHIRNSLAHHNRFILKSHGGSEISHLHFTDYLVDNRGVEKKTFEYEFKVEDIHKFVEKYVHFFLDNPV